MNLFPKLINNQQFYTIHNSYKPKRFCQLSHQIAIIRMKMLIGCSASFLLLLLLSCLTEPAESRTLHLDSCSVSVHTHELRKYYAHIRSNAVSSASSHAIKTSGKNLHECNVRLKWQKVVVTDPLFFFFFCDRFQKTTRSE